MSKTLCVCGKFHTDEEYTNFAREFHRFKGPPIVCDYPGCDQKQCVEERNRHMAVLNSQDKRPSANINYQLTCGCTLRERVEYYHSTTKRKFKTLLRRGYEREENQSPNITCKQFVNIIPVEYCKEHWPGEKQDFGPDAGNFTNSGGQFSKPFQDNLLLGLFRTLDGYEFTAEQANLIIQKVLYRVRP